jgi:YHS domain-containing protein
MLRPILLIVLMALVARAVWRMIDGVIEGLYGAKPGRSRERVQMARDPVCGTFVVPERAVALDVGSRRVYFCSARCRDAYRARTA